MYGVVVIACGRSREPVVSDVAHTHVLSSATKSRVTVPVCDVCQWCLMTHTCALRMHVLLARGQCLHACALQKQGTRGQACGCLTAHAASVVMFECVTSHRCVLQTPADVCANAHTHTNMRAHARKQGTPAAVSDCARTHTCVLQKPRIRGRASSFLGCVLIAHARSPSCVAEATG